MGIIRRLLVNLEANTAKFQTDMEKSRKSLDSMKSSLSIIKVDSLVNLGQRAAHTATQIYNLSKETAAYGDEVIRQSKILDMNTRQYQEFQYVAMRADVSMEALSTGVKRLSANMHDASRGVGEGRVAFEALGVSVTDSTGKLKSIDQMLGDLADRFLKMPEGPQKVALAMDIFGRSGEQLLPMLNMGREGLGKFRDEFEKFGLVIDDVALKKMAAADEKFEQIEARLKAMQKVTLAPLSLEVATFSSNVLDNFAKIKKWMDDNPRVIEFLMGATPFGPILRTKRMREEIEGIKRSAELAWPITTPGMPSALPSLNLMTLEERYKKYGKTLDEIFTLEDKYNEESIRGAELIERKGESVQKYIEALKSLGVTAERVLSFQADQAYRSLEIVKEAFRSGKATVVDYANALKAATSAMEKLVSPDITKELVDLEVETQKAMKEISWEDPDRQRKINEIIDKWIEARNRIQEKKITPVFNIPALESQFNTIKSKYDALKESIESQSINIKVSSPAMGGIVSGGGGGDGGNEWLDYVTGNIPFLKGGKIKETISDLNDTFQDWSQQWGQGINVPVVFTGEGSSKKPLSEKIQDFVNQFGGLQKAMSVMEANVSFIGLSAEYKKLEVKLRNIEAAFPGLTNLVRWTGKDWSIQEGIPQWLQTHSLTILDIKSSMEQLRYQMMAQQMQIEGSMQTGGYIPKTGLYLMHEGERVTAKGISVGDVNITIHAGTENPREIADLVAKAIKYKLSGKLEEALKG